MLMLKNWEKILSLLAVGFIIGSLFTYLFIWNYFEHDETLLIDEANIESYAIRGCDIGCIDYDLRLNGYFWNSTVEDYDILESELYRNCSAFCVERYGVR